MNKFDTNKYLFRYRSINDNSISALDNRRLYFSTPSNFNDPYDTLLYADPRKYFDSFIQNIQIGMDSYLEKVKRIDIMDYYHILIFWTKLKSEGLESVMDFEYDKVNLVKKMMRENTKVICFSETYDSKTMWAHYAYNHSGFLLVYDVDDLRLAKRFDNDGEEVNEQIVLEKILYNDFQIDMSDDVANFIRSDLNDYYEESLRPHGFINQVKLRKTILQKSIEWGYEKEWRLFPKYIDIINGSNMSYISIEPKAIIIGAKCMEKDAINLVEICKRHKIPIYRIFLVENDRGYKLKIGKKGDWKTY